MFSDKFCSLLVSVHGVLNNCLIRIRKTGRDSFLPKEVKQEPGACCLLLVKQAYAQLAFIYSSGPKPREGPPPSAGPSSTNLQSRPPPPQAPDMSNLAQAILQLRVSPPHPIVQGVKLTIIVNQDTIKLYGPQ